MKAMHDIYRRMVESLPLCVYLAEFEPEGRWEFVSPQIEALTGYGQEEWLAQPTLWLDSLHPGDRDRVLDEEGRHRALPRGTQWSHEYRLIRRDGEVVWVRDRAVLIESKDGRELVQGILSDIGGERLDADDPQPDVFRITCGDCGRVWASLIAETGCGRCGSTELTTESMDSKSRELVEARMEIEMLVSGIMSHLERLGIQAPRRSGEAGNGSAPNGVAAGES